MEIRNILLINAYSFKNLGDSGIVVAMINLLKKDYPNAKISVMSGSYEENKSFYSRYNVESVEPIWNIKRRKNFIAKYIDGLLSLLKLISVPGHSDFRLFRNADVIISVGGGYLYSSVKGPLGLGLINSLFHYYVGVRLKKCVIGFPQSVGPFNHKIDKFISEFVLSKISRLYLRESRSLENFSRKKNIKLLPDIALCKWFDVKKHSSTGDIINVGVTVLDWRFASRGDDWNSIIEYLEKIKIALKDLSVKHKKSIVVKIYPQVDVSENDSDLYVSNLLCESLIVSGLESKVVRINKLSHEEIIREYARNDLFIASRMHSAIFAINGNLPPIALAYQPKTAGTLEVVGLGDNALDIKTFKPDELLERLLLNIHSNFTYDYPEESIRQDLKEVIK
ncbi:Polysaccharide pyruvyl transferase family protein WcaK [Marisediminitalea aggregata]|uniref:Polysaccharide pyruvyl transferase family protein WcaK n=1 Tax=Marisediminitalea aggregata TaxID=634436 RepID=A0A1M5HG52_9ALTE|nr:polysaccharide pyruvyl transferase family protein [Marisediminitalea aggregata]SHG14868.1 Polysaccharide pyruvyl transferase family protein WcaK [Marisediminitalea aggregata]